MPGTPADIQHWTKTLPPREAWRRIAREVLSTDTPFDEHLSLFMQCYPDWESRPDTAVMWTPEPDRQTALSECMLESGCLSRAAFHAFSTREREAYWHLLLTKLNIPFATPPTRICDLTNGPEHPVWLPNARFNIVDSCFKAPAGQPAIIQKTDAAGVETWSYGDLEREVNRIAGSLVKYGCQPGDVIGLLLPMHFIGVACYLAILRMGGTAMPIAESFSPSEISKRLEISRATCLILQDTLQRDGKTFSLYEKARQAAAPPAIVYSRHTATTDRPEDIAWQDFLTGDPLTHSRMADASTHATLLFSSGTTGTPKAIPWTHATPLKAAADALLHHNFNTQDVVSWPTSLGWMMGPWLVFAGLINQATLALYTDTPLDAAFARFVQAAGVTVQGVVPTLVSHWRKNHTLENSDWHRIRLFTSTGECSNPTDMLYLSSRAGYVPVIEYCGGTEIGGAYVTSTLIEDNCPSVFTTPAMGTDFMLIDRDGRETTEGEVALLPPAMGLSLELLNTDHHAVYYADMPAHTGAVPLRRHGDCLQQLPSGGYRALGRNDDTMNLGGIKISAVEIERALAHSPLVTETAAIAEHDKAGPEKLVIFAVAPHEKNPDSLKNALQAEINQHLNPLFRIHEVRVVNELPKTISGKIMRKSLRARKDK